MLTPHPSLFACLLSAVGFILSLSAAAQAAEVSDATESLRHNIVYGGKLATAQDPFTYTTVRINSFGRMFCSGTLVAKDIVITAGHCAVGFVSAEVQIGDQVIAVESFKVHPKFVIKKPLLGLLETSFNDVMVVRLAGDAVQPAVPAKLPVKGDKVSGKEKLILAGFGCRNHMGAPDRGRLSYELVGSARYIKGTSLQINTSGAACKGDSGGPIYGLRNKQLTLFGITSWGDNYGLVTRSEAVEPHLGWIKKTIQELRSGIAL